MKEEDYIELKEAIEEAGFFTMFQPNGDGGVRLVLVSHRTDGQLHGNSFWVSFKDGRWYLITWAPHFYLATPGVDLNALCLECLRASPPIWTMPPEIASRYQLVEVSEEEYDRAWDDSA